MDLCKDCKAAIDGLLQSAQRHVIVPVHGTRLEFDASGRAECKECGLVWCRDTRSIHLLRERRRAEHASTENQVYGYIPEPIRDALRAYIYGVRPIPLTERVRILADTWLIGRTSQWPPAYKFITRLMDYTAIASTATITYLITDIVVKNGRRRASWFNTMDLTLACLHTWGWLFK